MIDGIKIVNLIRTRQNEVFNATLNGNKCILRLTHPMHRERTRIEEELKLLEDLGKAVNYTIRPMAFPSGKFIEEVPYKQTTHYAALFCFIEGTPIDDDLFQYKNANRIGTFLANLHGALSSLKISYNLPVMHGAPMEPQLIHGDFNSSNILVNEKNMTLIDFEDACYSSYEYELANSIYMTLFGLRHNHAMLVDTGYIENFLLGYMQQRKVDLKIVRLKIDERVATLNDWVEDKALAPFAIATSTDEWKNELKNFIKAYNNGLFEQSLAEISPSNSALNPSAN
jgi:Ser/Thr protein kinase RdoA (MazF antagonist)